MILAPYNTEVDELNEEILDMFDEEEHVYDRYYATPQDEIS